MNDLHDLHKWHVRKLIMLIFCSYLGCTQRYSILRSYGWGNMHTHMYFKVFSFSCVRESFKLKLMWIVYYLTKQLKSNLNQTFSYLTKKHAAYCAILMYSHYYSIWIWSRHVSTHIKGIQISTCWFNLCFNQAIRYFYKTWSNPFNPSQSWLNLIFCYENSIWD